MPLPQPVAEWLRNELPLCAPRLSAYNLHPGLESAIAGKSEFIGLSGDSRYAGRAMRPNFERPLAPVRQTVSNKALAFLFLALALPWPRAMAETVANAAAPGASQSAPVTLTLKDALELAQKNDPQFL